MTNKKYYESFWRSKVSLLDWVKKPQKIITFKKNNFKEWYEDGKLNLSFECIDYNIKKGFGNKTALIFLDVNNKLTSLSYKKLLDCHYNLNLSYSKNLMKILIYKIQFSSKLLISQQVLIRNSLR